jgi:hypothetical protein
VFGVRCASRWPALGFGGRPGKDPKQSRRHTQRKENTRVEHAVGSLRFSGSLTIGNESTIEDGRHGMGGWRAPEMQHWKPEMIAWLKKTMNVK